MQNSRFSDRLLAPGRRSRLAQLLEALDRHGGGATREHIEGVFEEANKGLENDAIVKSVKASLQATTQQIAGSDYGESTIRATEAKFERILRSLQVQMTGRPIESLDANGLGYNNILYIAVVLEYLKTSGSDEAPLLLVEEPESHLHPQLTTLLANYLATRTPGTSVPQTIVTTHSPTLAASVNPRQVSLLYSDSAQDTECHAIAEAGLEHSEEMQLQRMMDVTRATLYFAKGAILVEGISESLLFPVFAERLGLDLGSLHVSVIPICGVAFEIFKKLLRPEVFGIPVSIVTDGDPPVVRGDDWEKDTPATSGGAHRVSERTNGLMSEFEDSTLVRVHHSKVTLEYDLAEAALENANLMAEVWESQFQGTPKTFNREKVEAAGPDRGKRALCAWRGICRSSHSGSKAEFAHRLAARLSERNADGKPKVDFVVPEYIKRALTFVAEQVGTASVETTTATSAGNHGLPAKGPDAQLGD